MLLRNDFAVFILSHGRANNVKTAKTLQKHGYTGRWYVLIDDEDEQEDIYRKNFGDKVIQFSKKEVEKYTDVGDNLGSRKVPLFARNACFDVANDLGLIYFLELDDDYDSFDFRYEEGNKLKSEKVENLDIVFDAMIEFLEKSGALSVAFAQAGDFIGGIDNRRWKQGISRKAMNTFFCTVKRPFKFVGRLNEDVNTYVSLALKGKLFFTISRVMIRQMLTQANPGGMSETYLDVGTYTKSFYSVMFAPSCVKIFAMGYRDYRIHHKIDWNKAAPLVLREECKKRGEI